MGKGKGGGGGGRNEEPRLLTMKRFADSVYLLSGYHNMIESQKFQGVLPFISCYNLLYQKRRWSTFPKGSVTAMQVTKSCLLV